jgi:hypothetical protein
MNRVYPVEKMLPPSAFAPRYHRGLRCGRHVQPSPEFPGWFAVGYPPGERREIKRRHNRRCRRYRARLVLWLLADLMASGGP